MTSSAVENCYCCGTVDFAGIFHVVLVVVVVDGVGYFVVAVVAVFYIQNL